MISITKLLGQDAVSLGNAETTGRVQGVVIRDGQVVGVDVGDFIVRAEAVRSFEGDVLTYDEAGRSPDASAPGIDPVGRRVLTELGDELGHVMDLTLSADGRVESIVLREDTTISGDRLRVIGSWAAIVSADELPPPSHGSSSTR